MKKLILILGNGLTMDLLAHLENEKPNIDLSNLFSKGDTVLWPDGNQERGFLSYKHCPSLWNLGARPNMDKQAANELIEDIITCANMISSANTPPQEDNIYLTAYYELVVYLKHLFIQYDEQVSDRELLADTITNWGWLKLIQAAETSKMAFSVIKETFKETSATKGPIIMATVHGDIHDIGKNIVKVVLESYGYKIIDLGKDVPPETIVEAYHKHQPKAIGLSALMTTTVVSMEKTIALLKEVDNMCPIFVGGAVLTADFAKEINADFYVKDAMDTVELMNKIVK